ncbi:NADH-quinone oxidoreductase subunit C [Desulfuromusa kysingii]|uniref:NADH-quinone oxidoreductase subunit C n=1 Tax=Desulfuromusa kysingii TaxID=37625 RepID=A0A1H4CKS1_9BACT|nr:NADH-quinone oxidoreductase subunit C [Desulfuromusa kysingii]SEA61025.1 NADH-quinone oxidoreductase subunit C [Desulfuromusa kysingii]
MDINKVKKQWQGLTTAIEEVDYAVSGYDYNLSLERDKVRDLAVLMLDEGFYLVGLMAVHVAPAIEMVYQFAYHESRCRVMARTSVDENGEIATISDIFQGANWHEREVRDLHGVVFIDHPYLHPLILAEEDVDLKPLLKAEGKVKNVDAIRRKPPEPAPEPKPKVVPEVKPEATKNQEQS